MSFSYILYRITHHILLLSPWLIKKHPINPKQEIFIATKDWKKSAVTFIIDNKKNIRINKNPNFKFKQKV
jgi:hypothetical protein